MRLYLAGPRAGQNVVLKGVKFVSGIAEVRAEDEGLIRYLGRYQQAFPEGSAELEAALEAFGGKEIYGGSGRIPKKQSGDEPALQPAGEEPAAKETTDEPVDAPADSGSGGSVAKGDGQEDARLGIKEVVESACLKLDPTDPKQWGPGGSPKLAAVVACAGTAARDITRADLKKYGLLRKQVADQKSE